MADKYRHPHTSRGELDLGIEDLLGLDGHLPFFLGLARIEEDIDMRDDVEGDLLGKPLGLGSVADENTLGLIPQLVHRLLAGARYGLVGRNHHALDARRIMQRLQYDDELGGRAIGIGDDVPPLRTAHIMFKRLGIDLGHDERNFRIVAPAGGVIDDERAESADLGRPLLRYRRARRHQAEIDTAEIELFEIAALKRLVAIGDIDTHRAARGEGENLIGGKFAFGEDIEHLAADIAGGAHDSKLVTHEIPFLFS